jgi:hypothetical protein
VNAHKLVFRCRCNGEWVPFKRRDFWDLHEQVHARFDIPHFGFLNVKSHNFARKTYSLQNSQILPFGKPIAIEALDEIYGGTTAKVLIKPRVTDQRNITVSVDQNENKEDDEQVMREKEHRVTVDFTPAFLFGSWSRLLGGRSSTSVLRGWFHNALGVTSATNSFVCSTVKDKHHHKQKKSCETRLRLKQPKRKIAITRTSSSSRSEASG